MLFKSIGGRARPGASVALGVLLLAVLGTGNARAATTPAATGLTAPPGGVVDPNGRWWVSDHNAGFCRVSPPAGATPGTIEAATCLGGALADPPPRPGPASPGAPAFHDPTPGAPNSGDELVYVPDASTGSDKVMRLEWSPASGTFSLRDSITLLGGPDLRPTITALGTDGTLYVANGRSTTIQRVSAPASDAPTVAIVGTVDRALAMAAGEDAAGAVTLYFGEPAGITRLRPNAASPPASQPTAFDLGLVDAATPYEAGAMAYDAGSRGLYAGTSVAAHAGSGVDKVVRFAIGSAGTGETVGTGFTGITGLDLGRGALAVFDGPVGDGKDNLSFVGDPRVAPFVGPLPAAAAGAAGATAGATGAATAGATLGAGRTVGRVTRVRVAHRISRARLRRHGLRLSMRIAPGTTRIRVQITRRTGASRRHAKASWTRAITRAGAMSVTIRASAVRRLIDGRYTVRVTPVGATGAGPSTTSSLIITR